MPREVSLQCELLVKMVFQLLKKNHCSKLFVFSLNGKNTLIKKKNDEI